MRFVLVILAAFCITTAFARADEFSPRPDAQLLANGAQFIDVHLTGEQPAESTHLWVYLPQGDHKVGSLPCVLIAPGGTITVTGIGLEKSDQPEHLPYVAAGFAVVAFDLDGPVSLKHVTQSQLVNAVGKFQAAHGGVDNGKKAIDYIVARIPEVDANRLYAAGHSSAGLIALDMAIADKRIKGCCAYCPCTSVRKWMGRMPGICEMLEKNVSGFDTFVDDASPTNHLDALKEKPVLLFTSAGDTRVLPETVKSFATDLTAAGSNHVKLVVADTGDHYNSMIKVGIPAGIDFLKALDNGTAK